MLATGIAADLVLTRGLVRTLRSEDDTAEAVAVWGDRIVAVGKSADIESLVGAETQVVDLAGRVVIPGLTDCHVHVAGQAAMSHHVDARDFFRDVPDLTTLMKLMAERAAVTARGSWVTAHAGPLQDTRLVEGRLPTREELDRAVPDHPAFVFFGGHVTVANSHALGLAGVTRDTEAPPRGSIDFDERGEPTGVLRETAQRLVKDLVPGVESLEDAIVAELDRAMTRGVTSIHEITNGPDEVSAWQRLAETDRLRCRVHMLVRVVESRFDPDVLLSLGLRTGFGDQVLRIGGIKMSVDGGFTGRNSAFYDELEGDDPGHPMIRIERDELTEAIRRHHEAGIRVCVHAMGDQAIDMTIDSFEQVLAASPNSDHRHRIEHLGNWQLTEDRLRRIIDSRLIPVPNPVFLRYLGEATIEALGERRASDAWPFRSIVDAGIPLVFGTDAPAYWPIDPLRDVGTAVDRRTVNGREIEAHQSVTPYEALKAATVDAAFAGFVENDLGTIEPGKLADLAVLDDDPLAVPADRIQGIGVDMTFVGGRVVYGRNADLS